MNNTKFENGLFIFRRDLRTIDNVTLNLLNKKCKNIFTIFIFTPEQVGNKNKFKSNNCVQFMIESLQDLEFDIKNDGGKLYILYGENDKIIKKFIEEFNINIVSFNLDITPYAKARDESIISLCEKMEIETLCDYDYYLLKPGEITTGGGDPYQKYTPFYEKASKKKINAPEKKIKLNFKKSNIQMPNTIELKDAMKKFTSINPHILIHGGRYEALKTLKTAIKTQKKYSETRNILSKNTSMLSPFIKFGCISIREVYHSFKGNKDFLKQLFWRDFYAQILDNFPHVLKKSLKPTYDKVKWKYNKKYLTAWKTGTTGFPIVDACMRQMNITGWMHNRGRLIVSSFLIKTLLINWREGEQYFAQKLIDYDVPNNNGNWAWASGSGADSQPYFRIFNPWSQGEKYDSDCEYIKKWIPELKNIPNKDIHNWQEKYTEYKDIKYPKPIVSYSDQRDKALEMYKNAFK
jgi:deoxyribodipyrimidine photo-lyase